jgi:hypothetical protein
MCGWMENCKFAAAASRASNIPPLPGPPNVVVPGPEVHRAELAMVKTADYGVAMHGRCLTTPTAADLTSCASGEVLFEVAG